MRYTKSAMVKTLSEFQSDAERWIEEVRSTGQALVLTKKGENAAVVMDAREYERLMEELELLRDVHVAEQQLATGQGIPHDEALEQILSILKR